MADFMTRDFTSTPDPSPNRQNRPGRSGRRGPIALVLAASVLSATIASGVMAYAIAPQLGAAVVAPSAVAPAATPGVALPATTGTSTADPAAAPIVSVAERVSPAVVTITSSVAARGNYGPFSVPASGVGSGVIFRADGWILTNAHVVEDATSLVVTLKDGRELDATVIESDPTKDLAVVKVDATGLPTADIGSSATLQVGQLVVAIGSPLGQFTDSVTSGILSAMGRTIEVPDEQTRRVIQLKDLLQTDAAINPGNSGGPLLDGQGRVIGINTAVASSANGIGFAIPIDTAAAIIAKALGSPTT